MIPQDHALRQFFHDVVADCYGEHVSIKDREAPGVSGWAADPRSNHFLHNAPGPAGAPTLHRSMGRVA